MMAMSNQNIALNSELMCPACGGACLYQRTVIVYSRAEDAEHTTVTEINDSRVSMRVVNSAEARNPSSRRHGMAIRFTCETCNVITELTLAQHKGSTYLKWREA
jgi:hypothetical protein